jgi:hypothetical protein
MISSLEIILFIITSRKCTFICLHAFINSLFNLYLIRLLSHFLISHNSLFFFLNLKFFIFYCNIWESVFFVYFPINFHLLFFLSLSLCIYLSLAECVSCLGISCHIKIWSSICRHFFLRSEATFIVLVLLRVFEYSGLEDWSKLFLTPLLLWNLTVPNWRQEEMQKGHRVDR